jgi:hypothetical protein
MGGIINVSLIILNNTPGLNLLIIGLLIYVDKTHTDGKGQFCLEPVIALLTLLNFETRAQFVSQICLGYINDLDLSSTAHKTTSVRTADDKGHVATGTSKWMLSWSQSINTNKVWINVKQMCV